MKRDGSHPKTESTATGLGVRVPYDLAPDTDNCVGPGAGGLSVSPGLRDIPPHLVPARLRPLVPGARGSDNSHVWRMGNGPFAGGPLAPGLALRPDKPGHGLVEADAP